MADPYVEYLFEYDAWANRVVLEFLAANPSLAEATAPGVFGTALATMNHLLSAEGSYLNRLAGGPSYTDPPPMSLQELTRFARELAERGRQQLATLPEPDALLQRRYGLFHAKAVFGQLVQHGIEHRAQICTIAGGMGLEAPDLSSWRFAGTV